MSPVKDTATPSTASTDRLTGRVKWFNNKAGYGFITVTDGSRSGSDVFVHHSAIGVASQQYKYLVQGEYVDFELLTTPGGSHEFQANSVAGIKGGKLMCETRHEYKMARSAYKSLATDEPDVKNEIVTKEEHIVEEKPKMPRQKSAPRTRDITDSDKKEWTLVGNKKPSAKPSDKFVGKKPSRP
jgi:CspA family cold shock protein